MKTICAFVCLVLALFASSVFAESIVVDGFESYNNGSVVGQGGWESYDELGYHFIVQDIAFEGDKAVYCNSVSDNVMGKHGNLLLDGKQTVYVRTENRSGWNSVTTDDGNAQIRLTNGLWHEGIWVTFSRNGYVRYSDENHILHDFAPYNDNEWTILEMEWRSVDLSTRYCVNQGVWTDWHPFWHAEPFTGFDYVGFAFDFRNGGSGGVYFDALGTNPVPEPSTWAFLICGLITFLIVGDQILFFRHK